MYRTASCGVRSRFPLTGSACQTARTSTPSSATASCLARSSAARTAARRTSDARVASASPAIQTPASRPSRASRNVVQRAPSVAPIGRRRPAAGRSRPAKPPNGRSPRATAHRARRGAGPIAAPRAKAASAVTPAARSRTTAVGSAAREDRHVVGGSTVAGRANGACTRARGPRLTCRRVNQRARPAIAAAGTAAAPVTAASTAGAYSDGDRRRADPARRP